MSSHPFSNIPEAKLETLNALQGQFRNDVSPLKTNLMIGVYRDDSGLPFVLPSIRTARRRLFENADWNHEYPSTHLGEPQFRVPSLRLMFGDDNQDLCEGRIASMQCLGASGACHAGAMFLKSHLRFLGDEPNRVAIPAETWANHVNVFRYAGLDMQTFSWYDRTTHALDIDSVLSSIQSIPRRSVVVLQTSGNNPSGCDPSLHEWQAIADALLAGDHVAFLDCAYAGFVSGNFEVDCKPIRLLNEAGVPLLVAATFGKSFGLYGERVGILCITAPTRESAHKIESQMKLLARAETGAQPCFGAALVGEILTHPELRSAWEKDVELMAEQLRMRRQRLHSQLRQLRTPGDWSFLITQAGMFSFTSLDPQQIEQLREEHHVYLQDTGRLSIAGLNSYNIAHVARSIDAVVRKEI